MKKIIKLLIFVFAIYFSFYNFIFSFVEIGLHSIQQKIISNRILASVKDYNKTETLYSHIYYTEEDEDYIDLIKRVIDYYYPLLANDYGIGDLEKVTVIIYPDGDKLLSILSGKSDMYPMGAYYGGILNILSPRDWAGYKEFEIKKNFLLQGPIIHELSHFLLDKKTKGKYELWFTEGVALYYENKYTGFIWREDLKYLATEISIKDLTKNFRKLDEALAYRRAFDIIADFVEKNGEQKLQDLIY